MNNNVIIVSGGLDSVVLLHHICKDLNERNVHVLTFDYGQRISREIECSKYHADLLRAEGYVKDHTILNLSVFKDIAKNSAITNTNIRVPSASEDLGNAQPVTYVPFRNLLFLTFAAAHAESNNGSTVYYGAQNADEHSGYWDTNSQFLNTVNSVFGLNRKNHIQVKAPFIKQDKDYIVTVGHKLGVDFSKTHTCYNGTEIACGNCVSCANRIQSFLNAGLVDPIKYAINIPWKQ